MVSKFPPETLKNKLVPADRLSWKCSLDAVSEQGVDTGDAQDIPGLVEIIGQDRAVRALIMGCEVEGTGYNVFVCGSSGTGKTSTIKKVLSLLQKQRSFTPIDRIYVNNFKERDRPRLLNLPSGVGARLRRSMDDFIKYLCLEIPRALDGETYQRRRDRAVSKYESDERQLLRKFEDKARKEGFVLGQVQSASFTRPDLQVIVGKETMEMEEVSSAVTAGDLKGIKLDELEKQYQQLRSELDALLRTMRRKGRDLMEEIASLEKEVGRLVVSGYLEDLRESFQEKEVHEYFDQVQYHILENLGLFAESEEEGEGGQSPPRTGHQRDFKHGSESDPYRDFRVNVILDNSGRTYCPLVTETSPTYANLFGTVEKDSDDSPGMPHFLKLKAGSILQADQGFLVFHAPDAFSEPGVWKALKRTLKHGQLEMQPPEGHGLPVSLKPDPIHVNVKVIVTGDPDIYYELFIHDEDFARIFKIKADFEEYLERTPRNIDHYASFIRRFCREEKIRMATDAAIARLVEIGVREAERQEKISARFSMPADLLREADYYAGKAQAEQVETAHVEQARQSRLARHDLVERRYREEIDDGIIIISTTDSKVGHVNGLTIIDYGDHRFGRPCLITASVGAGQEGIVSLEREANMSGPIHNKGVLVITGFLRTLFGRKEPLALSAGVCFEQSYDEVEGDSASCSELIAILSAISGVPVRQGIAITGSLNQAGRVQAVGGINEKLEGFFTLCERRGLNGEQGVIIPHTNTPGLMLDSRIIDAVNNGLFHVWEVERIEEAVEIMTGMVAGDADENGLFPEGTLFRMVNERLVEFAKTAREKAWPGLQERRDSKRQAAAHHGTNI